MTKHEIETVMTVGAAEDRAFGPRSLGTAVAEYGPIRRRGAVCCDCLLQADPAKVDKRTRSKWSRAPSATRWQRNGSLNHWTNSSSARVASTNARLGYDPSLRDLECEGTFF